MVARRRFYSIIRRNVCMDCYIVISASAARKDRGEAAASAGLLSTVISGRASQASTVAFATSVSWTGIARRMGMAGLVWAALAGCAHGGRPDAMDRTAPSQHDGTSGVVQDAATTWNDAGPSFTPPTRIVAVGTWVPVRQQPRRDAPLVGYLRAGAIAAVEGFPVGRETCPVRRGHPEGGWYRLAAGGYVCVGGALAVPWPARGIVRPVQPQFDAGMPYQYAIVYGRVNMYRAPPTREDLRIHEPWRFPREGTDDVDGGTAIERSNTEAVPARHHRSDREVVENSSDTEERTPTGEPRLRDLRGERGSVLIRRLLTGMYVALDRVVRNREDGERYWRTQSGGYVRTGPLSLVRNVPTFHGVELDAEHSLPYAFMVSPHGWNYRVIASGRGVSAHRRVPRLTAIALTNDPPLVIGSERYYRTVDGFAVAARNVRIATLRTPPAGVGPQEKWIDIDLDAQVLVAYEGPRPVYVTLVSTGRRSDSDPDRDYETPAGSFRIRSKHVSTTMDGDTVADGPYSIEDVPWVMYFHDSYALHGAFWHNNFGWRMSHGCVNLSPEDARWLFFWSEPVLPEGWHGVFAGPDRPGTRVELHHGDRPAPRVPTR